MYHQIEVVNRLKYIGKSNRDFTYHKIYKFFGQLTEKTLSITVYGNRGQMINFNDDYYAYFEDNFKLIDDNEYNQHIRKIKLKKISSKYKK